MQSAGKEAVALAASAGLILDPWQELVLDHALAIREDGKFCANEVGVMVSRQNGKGSIIEALCLWGLFINDEQILHTAHVFKTAAEGFRRIEGLILGTPEFKAEVKRVVRGHGEESIELHSGARLMFSTRQKGTARGLTLDRVICDEAMYLTEEQTAALQFTTSARPNPQVAYLGSAGTQESTQFGRVRRRALKGDDPKLFYAEWSIDPCTVLCPSDCEEHDPLDSVGSYAKANPGLGIRISVEHVESERRSMGPAIFSRERLGVGDWPLDGEDEWRVIDKESWESRADENSVLVDPLVLAVDVTPDGSTASCIAAAGLNEEGERHVEITGRSLAEPLAIDHRPGTAWVVDRVVSIWRACKPMAVVIDKAGQAGAFIDALEAAGVKVISPVTREYAQACGEFYASVVPRPGNEPDLNHLDQRPLNDAVAGADKRDLADTWAWSKRNSTVDISPLVAATLAMWGYKKCAHKKRSKVKVAWG
ncbi:terminase [Streptomyces sp. NPDC015131]|uniref:terminase n=1 Tax=Streptomyces sp. NPDC015131 TaxID=3364941 RepID=UPI0036FD1174